MIQSVTKKCACIAWILCITVIFYSSCTKKTVDKPVVKNIPATISSISVNSGTFNTTVLITGTGFDTAPANDKVFFNGKAATVSAATATQLTVAVPLNAGTGNVTVSVNNATPVTGPLFTYIIPVTVTSINVNSGPYNTTVVITGTSFDATSVNDKVFFNGKAATVSAATVTQLTVAVPLGAGTGNITLSVNGAAAVSGPLFTYQLSEVVTTFAGNGLSEFADGTGTSAAFAYPCGVAVDATGNVFVADHGSHIVRKITAAGVVTTLAGSHTVMGSADGTGSSASFNFPNAVAVDAVDNVYVVDNTVGLVRKVTAAGVVTTPAFDYIWRNGVAVLNSFQSPVGIAINAAGNLYVTDAAFSRNSIISITTAGVVSTFAGSGSRGATNGAKASASFNAPSSVAVDAAGNVYVADRGNNLIRKISTAGVVTTLAGSGVAGSANGTGTSASFNDPSDVAVDAAGNVYVTDRGNNLIRKITQAGVVTTFAGSGVAGSANSTAASASFRSPSGIAVDTKNNIYVADRDNSLIRKISLQ
jgi:sugar lactone lactonase YvrE